MYGLDPGWYTGDVFSLYVEDTADDDDAAGLATTALAARGGATRTLGALLEGGLPSRYFGLDLMGKDWRHEFATYEARMSMADDIVRMYYTMNERVYDERIWHRMRLDQPQIWTIKHVAGQHVDSEKSHNWHIHACARARARARRRGPASGTKLSPPSSSPSLRPRRYHFQIDHAVCTRRPRSGRG